MSPELDPAVIRACRAEDIDPELVVFLAEALQRTNPGQPGEPRHVSPEALCHSFRDLALERFGGLALYVLEAWGVRETRDIGKVIARLEPYKILRFSEGEGVDDFDGILDLQADLSVERAVEDSRDA